MNLKAWCDQERGRASTLADSIGVAAPFMSQMAGGSRPVPPAYCASIVSATDGAVQHWDLRPGDWHRIWPELIGADGAPAIPARAPAIPPTEPAQAGG